MPQECQIAGHIIAKLRKSEVEPCKETTKCP